MKSLLKPLQWVGNVLYPPLCMHCETRLEEWRRLFCGGCAPFFELIDPFSRCGYCFCENGRGVRPCLKCMEKKAWDVRMAAALDYIGPVKSLVKGLKYGRKPYLATTGAAFLTAQLFKLEWTLPDLIIPVPRRHWFQGENHAYLLARALAKNLRLPCASLVKRHIGGHSQARLNQKQREGLEETAFYVQKGELIEGKNILLIDDVITTGATLRCTAAAVWEGFPKQVRGLALARALTP